MQPVNVFRRGLYILRLINLEEFASSEPDRIITVQLLDKAVKASLTIQFVFNLAALVRPSSVSFHRYSQFGGPTTTVR